MYIDDHFIEKVEELRLVLSNKYPDDYLDSIGLNEIIKISYFLKDLKPASKFRDYKYDIINYLNTFSLSDEVIEEPNITIIKYKYLEKLLNYLSGKYGFIRKNISIYSTMFFGFIFDLLFFILGFSKYYYYFPFFTILSIIFFVLYRRNKKKNGKFIKL